MSPVLNPAMSDGPQGALAGALNALSASGFFDASPVPTFVINSAHVVTHFNRACEVTLGVLAKDVIGTTTLGQIFYKHDRPVLADLIVDGIAPEKFATHYKNALFGPCAFVPEAYAAEGFFPGMGPQGRWLFFTAAPLRDASGKLVGAIETLQDITDRKQAETALLASQEELKMLYSQRTTELADAHLALKEDLARLERTEVELLSRNAELSDVNEKLAMAHEHLVQSEKLASIGQLAAGVAHEINNPIGYIFSNFGSLENYLTNLFDMLAAYEREEVSVTLPAARERLQALKTKIDLEFLKEDIPVLMRESKEGIVRVRKIVQDLKDFSHVDAGQEWVWANLIQGIDSTLNVVNNEIKYKADVVRDYGDMPDIECLPSQINQVVMNLVVNAAHAIGSERGTITIRTGVDGDDVWFEVADNGSGIPKDILSRIFDPFFTTKPVGKGTGLGLSLSYGIVQKHHGRLEVTSEVGKGTCFRVTLPIKHVESAVESAGTP